MAPAPPHAVVAGGGPVGGIVALSLRAAGLGVTLCDPAPDAEAPGRSYSMNLASVRMLGALGLWEALAPEAQPILDIRVSDGRPGRGASRLALHFDHAEIGAPMGHMVEDHNLRPVLRHALEAAGVERRAAGVAGFVEHDAGLTVDAGGAISAALLVGCDGRGGPTAERAGIARTVKRYGQTSLVATLGIARPHGGTAHQMFLPAGPLALLPLKGERIGVVWTEDEAEAARIAALPDDAFLDHVRGVVGGLYGALSLEGGRHAYPLTLVLAERLAAGRVVLAGDAAHGVHPIAGQGLNAGLKDAAALAECALEARRRGQDVGLSAPAAYERWRRFDAASLAAATDGVNRLFSTAAAGPRLLRGLGLGVAQAMPGLKRRLIREAAGLSGEVPRLMRGEPLR